MGVVYVVHAVDAEGPLVEDLEATFERIKQIFDISIEPSKKNLLHMQKGELDLGDKTPLIRSLLSPQNLSNLGDWNSIKLMQDRLCSQRFRNILPDCDGNGWIYSWFCVDHVGYEANPRKRDLGHHKVFDHCKSLVSIPGNNKDGIYFHYHPLPHNKLAHSSATLYLNSNHIFEIIARKIIERQWFPTVFRAGFHAQRTDSNWFLEQWIPFDYSNQATNKPIKQPDLAEGRFSDWRRAPKNWLGYHPSHDDYQTPGKCRRLLFRCLSLQGRSPVLEQNDVEQSFEDAEKHGSSILAFTNHDFQQIEPDINRVREMIKTAMENWPGVRIKYMNAREAAINHAKVKKVENVGLTISFSVLSSSCSRLAVQTKTKIFGPQPFLAIRDRSGNYFYDNFDFGINPNSWHYTFDWQTFPLSTLEQIAVAITTSDANAEIALYNVKEDLISYHGLN